MGESTEGYRGRIPRTPPRYVSTFNKNKIIHRPRLSMWWSLKGLSKEYHRNFKGPPKGTSKEGRAESQRNPRCLKVISKEPQRSSTGITKETARNLRNLEDAGTRRHRQPLGISKESQRNSPPSSSSSSGELW